MNPPLDYPTENDVQPNDAAQADITLATLIDRHASEQPVTTEMIEQACRRMDAAHEFTIVAQENAIDSGIARILKVFR